MLRYTVRGHELDDQQMAAVVDDSPTQLVIAGAGTGKTTTLIGKVRHMVEHEGVDPSRILMISLTNNTVADLRRVVDEEFGSDFPADVMTIHALGNRIYGRRPCVGPARNRVITGILDDLVQEDRYMADAMMLFVDSLRQTGLSDLSLNGRFIRQRGLRIIADALFRRGIVCEYERGSYSGKGFTPASISWEQGGHRIAVHDDDEPSKRVRKQSGEVDKALADLGVPSDQVNTNDLASNILASWGERIPEAVGAFISRCKCTRTTVHDLRSRNEARTSEGRPAVGQKLDLIDRVWDLYTLHCLADDSADYEDMVVQSAEHVRAGGDPGKVYDLVLVDEYQDVSAILVDLISALRRRMGFRLFCVGDDWQSIYSFSGGDVWQIYDFDRIWKDWGPISTSRIETTYRFPRQIADMTSRFVLRNPRQSRKTVRSPTTAALSPVHLLPVEDDRGIAGMVSNRLDNLPEEDSVFIIGRTRNDIHALGSGNAQFAFNASEGRSGGTVNVTYRRWDADAEAWSDIRSVTFLTAHSAKGLEADDVFVLADRDRGGFPSTNSSDLDALFEVRDEGILLPEERRVLYVAMTRAKKRLFLVNRMEDSYAHSSEGGFMSEIIADNGAFFIKSTPMCGECCGPMRIVSSNGRRFYGCCDYPSCRGTREFRGLRWPSVPVQELLRYPGRGFHHARAERREQSRPTGLLDALVGGEVAPQEVAAHVRSVLCREAGHHLLGEHGGPVPALHVLDVALSVGETYGHECTGDRSADLPAAHAASEASPDPEGLLLRHAVPG